MLQILQNLSSGETKLVEIPAPMPKAGNVLIKTTKSLVSIGTERMLIDFGKSGWIKKVLSQPDKVKMVLEKAKVDGILPTIDAVKSKLDQPLPLGYCNVGTVLDGGDTEFKVGTRVVSNGNHSEIVRIPKNLVVSIPENVNDETASFTVLGAIALQGVRLIKPTIGETIVVIGLGLIGLLTVQILKANGCRVLGVDFDSAKCSLAKQFGAEIVDLSKGQDLLSAADVFSRHCGVDGVIITASSKSNIIIHQAATMCRKRGRIVLVGVVGLELNRADFYDKELTFQVSCSYGPGRYDEEYEEKGKDYPFAFVRWTEKRNFEAVLDLMSTCAINIAPLISCRFLIEDAVEAYKKLDDPKTLGIILEYNKTLSPELRSRSVVISQQQNNKQSNGYTSFIGGGNYASRVLIPAFKNAGANLNCIVTSGGISAFHHGKKHGFIKASTDIKQALDEDTDIIVIATQHNMHAQQIILALESGKHAFVEKPLALNHHEIDAIELAQKNTNKLVMVGYNRRFSPHIKKIKQLLDKKTAPKTFIMTMNAGEIPSDHWTQDSELGGGRIIGEACHYIDLMRFLAGSKIQSFNAVKMGDNNIVKFTEDKALISLVFEDGSIGSIHYYANGGKAFPKERIEVFCDNAVLQLDNFRKLKGFGWKGFNKMNLWSQDKGQTNCVEAFMEAAKQGKTSPIPQCEVFEVARISVDISEQLRK